MLPLGSLWTRRGAMAFRSRIFLKKYFFYHVFSGMWVHPGQRDTWRLLQCQRLPCSQVVWQPNIYVTYTLPFMQTMFHLLFCIYEGLRWSCLRCWKRWAWHRFDMIMGHQHQTGITVACFRVSAITCTMAQLSEAEFEDQCKAWMERSRQLGDSWRLEKADGGRGVFLRRVGTLVVRELGEECEDAEVNLDDPAEVVQGVQVTCEHEVNWM